MAFFASTSYDGYQLNIQDNFQVDSRGLQIGSSSRADAATTHSRPAKKSITRRDDSSQPPTPLIALDSSQAPSRSTTQAHATIAARHSKKERQVVNFPSNQELLTSGTPTTRTLDERERLRVDNNIPGPSTRSVSSSPANTPLSPPTPSASRSSSKQRLDASHSDDGRLCVSAEQPKTSPARSPYYPNIPNQQKRTASSGGHTSDGSMSYLSSPPFDIKRLLSKPAKPTHSTASTLSIPSDSEFSNRRPSPSGNRQRFPPLEASSSTLVDRRPSLPSEPSPGVACKLFSRDPDKDRERDKQRDLEKRRTVSGRSRPRACTTSLQPPTIEVGTSSSSAVRERDKDKPKEKDRERERERASKRATGLDRRVPSDGPKSGANTSSRTLDVSQDTPSKRSTPSPRLDISMIDAPPPPGLTPAEAVAYTYKQQELRRKLLIQETEATAKGSRTPVGAMPEQVVIVSDASHDLDGGLGLDVMAGIGGVAEEGVLDLSVAAKIRMQREQQQQPKPPKRKLSKRRAVNKELPPIEKKVSGSVSQDEPAVVVRERERRPSLSVFDRRSITIPRERRSLRLSIEDFVEVDSAEPSSIPSAKNGGSENHVEVESRIEQSPIESSQQIRGLKGKPKEEYSPGRLWKLVKRLSSGALREHHQYQHQYQPQLRGLTASPENTPPVPAIPKGLVKGSSNRSTPSDSGHSGILPPLTISLSRSASVPLSAPANQQMGTHERIESNNSEERPSTTTHSSSSDLASSQFFHRSHSARSSTSSYGELVLPPIGQHILPPEELFRFGNEIEDNGMGLFTEIKKPEPKPPKLTIPLSCSLSEPPQLTKPAPSPIIPLFSNDNPVNAFPGESNHRLGDHRPHSPFFIPVSEFGLTGLTAPPRPPRSSRRSPSSGQIASGLPGPPPPEVILQEKESRKVVTPPSPVPTKADRSSSGGHSQASTARVRKRSSLGNLTINDLDPEPGAQLTFRDLNDQSRHHTWTEQEKLDKWDDLLERSAKAGGTIHVGARPLLSDTIRDSCYSEL